MKLLSLYPRVAFFAAILLAAPGLRSLAQKMPDPAGDWLGTLKVQGTELRLIMHVQRGSDGALKATMDSPDQNANGIAVPSVRVSGDSLLLGLPAIAGEYRGRLLSDSSIDGEWKQAGMSFPLPLARMREPLGRISRPQEPKKPYPYDEEEVTVNNKAQGFTLAGTLTLPRSGRPSAAVVLITGSGPEDRDETIFNHKPFWILADALTRNGIAVLRCDDRGVGGSKGSMAKATSEDFAGDALAAVDYLRSRREIDPKRIGLLGHSEGGMIAPMAALKDKHIAFLVLLAGTGVTGEEILYEQGALISRASGVDEAAIAANRDEQRALFDILRAEPDSARAVTKIEAYMRAQAQKQANGDTARAREAEAGIHMQSAQLNSPWFRFFLFYDPRPALRKTTIPVLALNGEKDLQVSPAQNLPQIEAALKQAGNKHYITKKLPGLNHLFQRANTGALSEYASIDETFAPAALAEVCDWVVKVTGTKK